MKKLFNLIILVTTSLLLLSCEKEKYPGAYPYDDIVFYNEAGIYENTVTEKDSVLVIYEPSKYWDKNLYPMTLWVDNEEIATISQSGYLTGKKEGTVTIYAKVMSVNGELEDSIKYTVNDYLKEFIRSNNDYLKYLGVDKNNDDSITTTEFQETEVISKFIGSDFLFEIAPYMPKLREVEINADTSSRTLDLSGLKIEILSINDSCEKYTQIHDEYYYNEYKSYFLKELILNKEIKTLAIVFLPGIKTLDLREYTNLKYIIRPSIASNHNWVNMDIIIPKEIETIDFYRTKLIANDVYPNLEKMKLRYQEPIQPRIKLSKQQFPKLKQLHLENHINYIDISSYESSDLDYVYALADTIVLSESMHNKDFFNRNYIIADEFIIK